MSYSSGWVGGEGGGEPIHSFQGIYKTATPCKRPTKHLLGFTRGESVFGSLRLGINIPWKTNCSESLSTAGYAVHRRLMDFLGAAPPGDTARGYELGEAGLGPNIIAISVLFIGLVSMWLIAPRQALNSKMLIHFTIHGMITK